MAQHKLSDGEICLFLVIVYGLCHYLNYGSIIPVSVSVFTQCSSLCVYVSSWDLLYLCLYPNFPYFRRVAVLIRAHPNCIWPHLNLITSAKIPFPKKFTATDTESFRVTQFNPQQWLCNLYNQAGEELGYIY